MVDPNPVLDEANPTASVGLASAARLCEILGLNIELEQPAFFYERGWGNKALGAKPIVCSWTLTLADRNGRPTSITFDLFDDDSPLALGLDDKHSSITDLINNPHTLTLSRPQDKQPRVLPIYVDGAELPPRQQRLSRRVRLDVTGIRPLAGGLSATVREPSNGAAEASRKLRAKTLARRIHRYNPRASVRDKAHFEALRPPH